MPLDLPGDRGPVARLAAGALRRRSPELVEVGEVLEHDVVVDPEVNQARDLIDSAGLKFLHQRQARRGRPEQPSRSHVPIDGVLHADG